MAQKTSDKTSAKLAALIDEYHYQGPTALHGHILDVFRVVDQPGPRGPQPVPKVGQKWRNRTSARLVRITNTNDNDSPGSRRIEWECIDGSRGPNTGSVWISYWTERFDHEETN